MGLIRPRSVVTNTMTKHKVVFLGKAWAWAGCSGLGGPVRRKLPLEPQSSPRLRRRWSNQLPALKAKKCGAAFLLFWKICFLENLNFPVSRSQPVSAWGSEAALGDPRWLGWWSQAGAAEAADAAEAGALVDFFFYAGAFLLRQSAGANARQTGLGSGR